MNIKSLRCRSADAKTIRTTTLALSFSVAEYASPVRCQLPILKVRPSSE